MNTLKILTGYFLFAAIAGLLILHLNHTNFSKSLPTAFYLGYILICVFALSTKSRKKTFYCLLFLNLFHFFAIKTKGIIFVFSVGISVFHFFKLPSFTPQSINVSISYIDFSQINDYNSLFGINLIALIFIIFLIVFKKKLNA